MTFRPVHSLAVFKWNMHLYQESDLYFDKCRTQASIVGIAYPNKFPNFNGSNINKICSNFWHLNLVLKSILIIRRWPDGQVTNGSFVALMIVERTLVANWSLFKIQDMSLIIIIIIIIPCEFFTPVLADGLSQEPEWQQVSSSLQDSSQYSGWFL